MEEGLKKGGLTSGIVLGVNAASAYIIPAFGFTQAGVLAGSTAAGIQSSIGIVAAGSSFATFQSLGALGLGILGTAALPVTLGAGLTVGGYYLVTL